MEPGCAPGRLGLGSRAPGLRGDAPCRKTAAPTRSGDPSSGPDSGPPSRGGSGLLPPGFGWLLLSSWCFSGGGEWIPGFAGAVATAGISWASVTGRGSRGTLLALGLGSCMDAELPRLAVAGGSFFSSEREPLGEFLGCLGGEGQEHGVPAGAGKQLAVEIFQDLSPRNLPPSHPRKAWGVFIFLNFPL